MKTNLCFRNSVLSSQQVAKNQIRLNLCGFSGRQNSVAETKNSQVLQSVCRCDVSPERVAATSPPTCAQGVTYHRDVLLQLVA